MSNSDDWQMEAVHEQFEVFDSLVVPSQTITVQDNKRLSHAVVEVMRKHLRLSNAHETQIQRRTFSYKVYSTVLELCKVMNGNVFEFSFVVIVTNQNVYSRGLCKIPICIVTMRNRSVFIDTNSKVFNSWDTFMLENSLPACKFCFPVDGRYDVGGKLKIDFASTRAQTQSLVKMSMFASVVGKIVDVGKVAASCLIRVAPKCFKIISDLMPVAERFLRELYKHKAAILSLGMLFYNFKTNKIPIWDVMLDAYQILVPLCKSILPEAKIAWEGVKKSLPGAYNKLQKWFPKFFASASPSSQHDFLALTERVDAEAVEVEKEAMEKISDASMLSYNQQIFRNTISDCALYGKLNSSSGGKIFEETTENILNVTKEIAEKQQITTLHDLAKIFESVSIIVFEEYKREIDYYSKSIKAARNASKGEFDEDAFNEVYGIKGDPKDHFMQEVLQSCGKSLRSIFKVNEKTNEIEKQLKTVLIPLWKKHNDDDVDGLYRCIGARGTGNLSTQAWLSVFQENFGQLRTENTKSRSLHSMTAFYSDEFNALVSQEVNEENTSEGLVFFEKHIQ